LASIFKQLALSKIKITYPSPIFSDFSFQKCDALAEAYLIPSPNPLSHPSLPFLTSLDIRSLANTTIRYVRVAMSGCVQLLYNLSENISYWTTLIQPCSSSVFNHHTRPEGGSSEPNEPPLDPPLYCISTGWPINGTNFVRLNFTKY